MGAEVASIGIGSKAWAGKVRKQAKALARSLDTGYVEMGSLLWEVHKTGINNDNQKPPVYTLWGYSTFGEWVEEDLGLHRRKAERLRAIGEMFDTTLAHVDKATKTKLAKQGWSKLRELRRVFENKSDLQHVLKWIEVAETHSYPEFVFAVQKWLDKQETKVPKPEGSGSKGTFSKGKGEPASDDDDDSSVETFRTKMFSFLCIDEQIDTVREALERAEELAHTKGNPDFQYKKSNLLSLICLDFLATNNFDMKMDGKTRADFLHKLEVHLGVSLVAIEKGDVAYGKSAFAKAVKKLAKD